MKEDPAELRERERKARWRLKRLNFFLLRSRSKDPKSFEFQGYIICTSATGTNVAGILPAPFALKIDDVEKFIEEKKKFYHDLKNQKGPF